MVSYKPGFLQRVEGIPLVPVPLRGRCFIFRKLITDNDISGAQLRHGDRGAAKRTSYLGLLAACHHQEGDRREKSRKIHGSVSFFTLWPDIPLP